MRFRPWNQGLNTNNFSPGMRKKLYIALGSNKGDMNASLTQPVPRGSPEPTLLLWWIIYYLESVIEKLEIFCGFLLL